MRLNLARKALTDGRDKGCRSDSVSAIVRGNGREGGAGCITSTLYPVELRLIENIYINERF
jgi:hypothetical protein